MGVSSPTKLPYLVLTIILSVFVSVTVSQSYPISLQSLSHPFHSIGAQSTAGTARFLYDYPSLQQSHLLDLLFKPQYGAALQHLKVEIGGDTQISCGAEASMSRSVNSTDDNFNRGYEIWLMEKARERNPSIVLLALVYAWPDWVCEGETSPWVNDACIDNAVEYMTRYVVGVYKSTGLKLDWVGCWNEREYTPSYVIKLRHRLTVLGFSNTRIIGSDSLTWSQISTDYLNSSSVRAAVDALSSHYPMANRYQDMDTAQQALLLYGVPLFASEDYSCYSDPAAALVWSSRLNQNFIVANLTLTSAWHLISSFYPSLPFFNQGLITANEPWSGYYKISLTLWTTAHFTHFTTSSMRYLAVNNGSGYLKTGGSYVSLVDPSSGDFSVIVETTGAGIGTFASYNCNGGLHYVAMNSTVEEITFVVNHTSSHPPTLYGWVTCMYPPSTVMTPFSNITRKKINENQFQFSSLIHVNCVYTFTTIVKDKLSSSNLPSIPPSRPFPLPYRDDFQSTAVDQSGRYLSTQMGGFEISYSKLITNFNINRQNSDANKVLRQMILRKPCCNFINNLNGPYPITYIGSSLWQHIKVEMDVAFPALLQSSLSQTLPQSSPSQTFLFIGLRAQLGLDFFQAAITSPTGVFLVLFQRYNRSDNGVDIGPTTMAWCVITSITTTIDSCLRSCELPLCIATGDGSHAVTAATTTTTPHHVSFTIHNNHITINLNQIPLFSSTSNAIVGGGFVALGSDYENIEFDNLSIDKVSPEVVTDQCSGRGVVSEGFTGATIVMVPCGEPGVEHSSKFMFVPLESSIGVNTYQISLLNYPTLCLTVKRGDGNIKLVTDSNSSLSSPNTIVVDTCNSNNKNQIFKYELMNGMIKHVESKLCFSPSISTPLSWPIQSSLSPLTLGPCLEGVFFWSSDDSFYIHGPSSQPMKGVCLAAC